MSTHTAMRKLDFAPDTLEGLKQIAAAAEGNEAVLGATDCSARADITFEDWWHTDGVQFDPMGSETIYEFAHRIGKLAYGAGICEGMTRHNLRRNPKNMPPPGRHDSPVQD